MRFSFTAKPSKLLAYSIAFNIFILLFGPADYFLNGFSPLAASYLILCLILFYLGLRISEGVKSLCVSPPLAHSVGYRYFLSRSGQLYVNALLLISSIASIYFLYYNIVELGGGFGVAGASARIASEALSSEAAKPLSYKVSYLLSCSSIVFLPLILSVHLSRQRLYVIAILFSSFLFILAQLFVGNRNPSILQFLFILFSVVYGAQFHGVSPASNRLLKSFLPFLSIGLFTVVILIFAWRQSVVDLGQYDLRSLEKSAEFLGSYQIRPIYQWIYEVTGLVLFPLLYDLLFYVSHSFPFFLKIFDLSSYSGSFDFVFTAPHIFVLTGNSGYVMESVGGQAFAGLYPTAVHGFLMDFGIWLGPVFILIFGILVGKLYAFVIKSVSLLSMMAPLTLIIPLIFPVYYVSWGFSDMIFLVCIFHFFVLSFLGGVSRVSRLPIVQS